MLQPTFRRTPCPDIFAMDSKELSSISYCFGDQKAIKTPKLNTIWLELIARVLNMLIGLKGDNYYSKVFKRVNYRLSNNTFWVVINMSNTPIPLKSSWLDYHHTSSVVLINKKKGASSPHVDWSNVRWNYHIYIYI